MRDTLASVYFKKITVRNGEDVSLEGKIRKLGLIYTSLNQALKEHQKDSSAEEKKKGFSKRLGKIDWKKFLSVFIAMNSNVYFCGGLVFRNMYFGFGFADWKFKIPWLKW